MFSYLWNFVPKLPHRTRDLLQLQPAGPYSNQQKRGKTEKDMALRTTIFTCITFDLSHMNPFSSKDDNKMFFGVRSYVFS